MVNEKTVELLIEREFPFPRQMVYEAWTQQEHLLKWMGPAPEVSLASADMDVREGGKYRLGFQETEEKISYVAGEYLSVKPPEKLVFTWTWEQPANHPGIETLVTITFTETADGTKVILRHQRFTSNEMCDHHRDGWNGTLDKLSNFFNEER